METAIFLNQLPADIWLSLHFPSQSTRAPKICWWTIDELMQGKLEGTGEAPVSSRLVKVDTLVRCRDIKAPGIIWDCAWCGVALKHSIRFAF